ncbi:hypothetical protein CLOACE_10290 [Clostridium acetireducens DSM 10703]|uniref:Uncharacterized protein n=1 Tax=Clostridium acetireducens DSM 10703 TaxID=1121290 RepID=A0A1E8EZG9_9CLOT|nr:hypothetical protein [Clostridium acetireducens]OFI06529.1 hypothetical protein CLOACE_10290 [Clostridium acetireducens DSM 10703]
MDTIGHISSNLVQKLGSKIEEKEESKCYPIQQASIPFTGCAMTNGRKSIQSFFQERSFTQLIPLIFKFHIKN